MCVTWPGNVELVRWMTNQGVGTVPALAEDDGGDGPLFAAVKGGSKQVVSLLLEQGARLEVRDRKGRTPLAWCAAHGKTDMARFLHSKGASLLARDLQGNVPRVLAYKHRHAATAEALTELARQDYLLRDDDVSSVAGEVGPFVLVPPRDGEQQLRQQLQLQQQQPSVVVQALQ